MGKWPGQLVLKLYMHSERVHIAWHAAAAAATLLHIAVQLSSLELVNDVRRQMVGKNEGGREL